MVEDNFITSEKSLIKANQRISLLEHVIEEYHFVNELALLKSNQSDMDLKKIIKELNHLLKLKNQTMTNAYSQAGIMFSEKHASISKLTDKKNIDMRLLRKNVQD